jgi:hypothetical protein
MYKYLSAILIFTIINIFNFVKAQTPDWSWAKDSGGEGNDFGSSTATDTLGNVFVTGTYNSDSITFGSFTLMNMGTTDMFIVKYDATGNILWAKGSGATDTYSYGIATDGFGNVYVIGRYGSASITFGTITLINSGSWDIFIVKYDANGNVLWAKSEGGPTSDYGYSTTTDVQGNVYISGRFNSPSITFGGYTVTNSGNADMFIVKYDSIGNVLWANSLGASSDEVGNSIATDLNGNVYVTGYYVSPTIIIGSDTLVNSGGSDMFIVKYDLNGNIQWAKNAGGTGWDNGYSVDTDDSGNIYLTGYFHSPSISFGAFTLTNSTNLGNTSDIFIVKLDFMGNIIWANGIGSIGDDVGYCIVIDDYNNVYVTGNYNSPSINFAPITLTNAGSSHDVFIAKYNISGNLLWAKGSGGIYDDYSNSVAIDASYNVLITGRYSSSSINFGASFLTNSDSTGNSVDMFTAKLNCANTPNISSSAPTTFCNGDSILLTSSAGDSYLWSNGDTAQTITVTDSGSYFVTVNSGVCSLQSLPTIVTVNPLPIAPNIFPIGNVFTFCADTFLTLTGNTGGTWSNGSFLNEIIVSTSGDYFVTTSNTCGVDTSNIISLLEYPLPTPSIIDSITYLTIDSAIYTTYQWYLDGVAIQGANNAIYYYTGNGEYSVQVTNLNGCDGTSDSINILTVGLFSNSICDKYAIKCYPNPANEILNILSNFEFALPIQVRIVDMIGNHIIYKEISFLENGLLNYQINIGNLSSGVYFIYINENKFKFIKN